MRRLVIYREFHFAACLTPFWVVTRTRKAEFMDRFQLADDLSCELDAWGHPLPRLHFDPDRFGARIHVGQTLELSSAAPLQSVFAVTAEGLLSNEVVLTPDMAACHLTLAARGGFLRPGYPHFTVKK